MKVVINRCYGGFGLSDKAFELYLNKKGIEFEKENDEYVSPYYFEKGHLGDRNYLISKYDLLQNRIDEKLVEVVEELGDDANTPYSELRIVEVPDDVQFTIEQYDGDEWIAEVHRTWC